MGQSPPMNMLSFDKKIWLLHRKLHHRFLRFQECFVSATEDLKEYKDTETSGGHASASASKSTASKVEPVISLLSSDSDSDSETSIE